MSLAGPEEFGIFIGARRSAVARRGDEPTWHAHEDPLAWLAGRGSALGQRRPFRRPGLTVWLSSEFARPFLLPAQSGARTHAELEALAGRVGARAAGLQEPCVAWIEPAPDEHARMGAVAPLSVRSAITEFASSARVHLRSIRPWWASAQAFALATVPQVRMMSIRDDDGHILLASDDQRWLSAQCHVPGPTDVAVEAMVGRLRFAIELPDDACAAVRLVDGSAAVREPASCAHLGPMPEFAA